MGMDGQDANRLGHGGFLQAVQDGRFTHPRTVKHRDIALGKPDARGFLDPVRSTRVKEDFEIFSENVLACASRPVYISNQRVSW